MASLNLCQFIGNVGADPEIRVLEGGSKFATTRIAVTERYTDRNQQPQQRTEWIGLVFNGKLVDVVEAYVKKGSPIYVSGKFHNREWTDQGGVKHTFAEIQVREMQLLSKPQGQDGNTQRAQPAPQYAPQPPQSTNYPQPPAPQPPYQAPPQPHPATQYQAPVNPYHAPAPAEGPDLPF